MDEALCVAVIVVVFPAAMVVVPPKFTVRTGEPAPDSSGLIIKSPAMPTVPVSRV